MGPFETCVPPTYKLWFFYSNSATCQSDMKWYTTYKQYNMKNCVAQNLCSAGAIVISQDPTTQYGCYLVWANILQFDTGEFRPFNVKHTK